MSAAQTVHGKNLSDCVLRKSSFQMFRIDGEVPKQGLFHVGVCGFRSGTNGKAGQHKRCHNKKKG